MLRRSLSLCLLVLVAFGPKARADVPVYKSDDATIAVGSMLQLLGFGQDVADPVRNDLRAYLFMKEARLRLSGNYERVGFHLELGLGSEDTVNATTGIALGLLDLNADIPLGAGGTTWIRAGQMKVPFGREALTYSGNMSFGDRSIEQLGFKVGRDVGVALVTEPGLFTGVVGLWTGGGRDVPPNHYLPQKLGFPLVAARFGLGNVDGKDPFVLEQDDLAVPERTRGAFFVNGLYTHDSLVGHSTVLNVKLADKNLLLDSNWNPYIAAAAGKEPEPGDFWQAGADAAVRAPLGSFGLTGELEGDWAGFSNPRGAVHLAGGRAQVGIFRGPVELGARYAILFPDKQLAANGVQLTGSDPMHELTPSATWHVHGRNLELVADLPLLFHVPVFTEKGVGSYVGTELPDQSAIVGKTGTVAAQNVVEGRMLLQAQF